MPIAVFFYRSLLWRGVFFLSVFILNVAFARHFQASVSGEVLYLVSIYSFIILALSLSLESSMGYYVSRDEISLSKIISFCVVWTIGVSIIVFLFAGIFKAHTNYPSFILITVTYISGFILSNYITGIFYAKQDYLLPNVITSGINVLLISLLVVPGFFEKKIITDENYIIIFFCAAVVQAVVLLFALMLSYKIKWLFTFPSGKELGKIFGFGITALTANVLFFLLCRIDYWFVKLNCSNADLGNYIQVSKLAQMFFIIPSVLSGAIFSLTASQKEKEIYLSLITLQRILFLFYTACCIILILTGNLLFPLVFGNSFNHMYIPFLFLVPGILALPGLYIFTAHYSGNNKIIINIKGTLLALIVVFFADWLMVPRYGIAAAAGVSSVGYIVYQAYVLHNFRNQFNRPVSDFFLIKTADIMFVKQTLLKHFKTLL